MDDTVGVSEAKINFDDLICEFCEVKCPRKDFFLKKKDFVILELRMEICEVVLRVIGRFKNVNLRN